MALSSLGNFCLLEVSIFTAQKHTGGERPMGPLQVHGLLSDRNQACLYSESHQSGWASGQVFGGGATLESLACVK